MKKNVFRAFASAARFLAAAACTAFACTFAACSDDEPVTASIGEDPYALRIGTGDIRTRATESAFEQGDSIGLFGVRLLSNDMTLGADKNYIHNVRYTLEDLPDTWNTTQTVRFPADGTPLNLFAYYPYRETLFPEGTTTVSLRTAADQSELEAYKQNDFITATLPGVTRSGNNKVLLDFYHQLSQLIFRLKINSDYYSPEDVRNATLRIGGVVTKAGFRFNEKTQAGQVPENSFTLSETRETVVPYGNWTANPSQPSLYEGKKAIVLPQELGGKITLELTIKGRTITKTLTEGSLRTGTSSIFTLSVSYNDMEVTTKLHPWDEGNAYEEDMEEGGPEDPDMFITQWEVPADSAVMLPLPSSYMDFSTVNEIPCHYDFTVYWGDGTSSRITGNNKEDVRHTYKKSGRYTIRIDGTCEGWGDNNAMPEPNKLYTDYLVKVVQWGNTGFKTLEGAFKNCRKLESIPDAPLPGAVSYNYTFASCTSLKKIPENLLANASAVKRLMNTFEDNSSLESIPAGLLRNCPNLEEAFMLFSGCSALREVPAQLFADVTALRNANSVFSGCTSLTRIGDVIFRNCTNLENVSGLFGDCSSLTNLPEDLFENCSALKNVSMLCTGCTQLENIPGTLFKDGSNITDFSFTFQNCSSLQSIPSDLFRNCPNASDFNSCFQNCSSLQSIPSDLFRNCPNASDFTFCFQNCTSLAGTTPLNSEGTQLWKKQNATGYQCFNNCTGLDDYGSIDANWK